MVGLGGGIIFGVGGVAEFSANKEDRVSMAACTWEASGELGVPDARQVGCVASNADIDVRSAEMQLMMSSMGVLPGRV